MPGSTRRIYIYKSISTGKAGPLYVYNFIYLHICLSPCQYNPCPPVGHSCVFDAR